MHERVRAPKLGPHRLCFKIETVMLQMPDFKSLLFTYPLIVLSVPISSKLFSVRPVPNFHCQEMSVNKIFRLSTLIYFCKGGSGKRNFDFYAEYFLVYCEIQHLQLETIN